MKAYLHPASPNCMTVSMTAAHLGVPLETELVDLFNGEQNAPPYRAINPNGTVPTLCDGDFVLWESSAINQYLAAGVPGNALWPQDERRRADIARWQFWALCQWTPALQPYLFENLFKRLKGLGEPDPAVLDRAAEKFNRFAGVLDAHLAGRKFLVGDQLTLADIAAASYLMYAEPARIPLGNHREIGRWFDTIRTLPSWQKAQPQPF
jgi:glutathione S-transferase